jgi:hypothetical protein
LTDKKQLKEKKIKYPTAKEVIAINKYVLTGQDESGLLSQKVKDSIDKMNANLVPRDPERIPAILDALRTIWINYPDMRLGQLLLNFVFLENSKGKDPTDIAVYNQEDDLTLNRLQKIIRERRKTLGTTGKT